MMSWQQARLLADKWYWIWRLSFFSKPWFWLKTFIHLHWHAKQIAIALDDCTKGLAQMKLSPDNQNVRVMSSETNSRLAAEGYKALPDGWKWR
jgi:hypothetical protein